MVDKPLSTGDLGAVPLLFDHYLQPYFVVCPCLIDDAKFDVLVVPGGERRGFDFE